MSEDVTRYRDLRRRERAGTGFASAFLALAVGLVLVTAAADAFSAGGGMWAARFSVAVLALTLGYHLVRIGWGWWRGSTSMGRVDWLRSMAGGRFGYAIFLALFWAYASVLGAVLAVTGLGRDTHGLVPFVLIVGCWLLAYQGAVQTVAWWRRRQARQG